MTSYDLYGGHRSAVVLYSLPYSFESSRIARFIMDVEKQLKRSTTVTLASNVPWHDLENKVKAQQRKVIETCQLQTLCKKARK